MSHEEEQCNKTIAIKLFDRIYQCSFFQETTAKVIIEDEALYISYNQDNVLYFNKAFESEKGFV